VDRQAVGVVEHGSLQGVVVSHEVLVQSALMFPLEGNYSDRVEKRSRRDRENVRKRETNRDRE